MFDDVSASGSAPVVLRIENVSKTFAGQRALDSVSLRLEAGEIRALVGQNGSGKSTLIKILAGYYNPDPGARAEVDGIPLLLGDGVASEHAGLRFVHQDLALVHSLDAVDNLALGHGYPQRRGGTINWRAGAAQGRRQLAALGYDIDVKKPTGNLTASERTAVAIARAMSDRRVPPRVLILDEPTANLPGPEAARLYTLVKGLKASGLAVLFVSHHLNEVFELTDTVSVLRDGRQIHAGRTDAIEEDDLVELMVGRQLARHVPAHASPVTQRVALEVRDLQGSGVKGLDFDVCSGERVGVAGLTGSGREAVASLIFGGSQRSGSVTVDGIELPPGRPDLAIKAGLGLVPAGRRENGVFINRSLSANVTVIDPGRFLAKGFISRRAERADVAAWLTRLGVRPPRPDALMATLSGGNQQKVILARWLRQAPKVLILDEPTQGVDVAAKADIHRMIDEAASSGAAVLVISTDHEELARLCDRVIVVTDGRSHVQLHKPHIEADAVTSATLSMKVSVA